MGNVIVAAIVIGVVLIAVRTVVKNRGDCPSCGGRCEKCHSENEK